MKHCSLIIILLWSVLHPSYSLLCERKWGTIQKIHTRTGEAIANDKLIHTYEKEHQQFYVQETKYGRNLTWPDVDNKNLLKYCKQYRQHSIPTRRNEDVTGIKIETTLHYEKENTHITNIVIIVWCKIIYKSNHNNCYITRAPEPDCVYALKRTGNWTEFIFTIINKYCNFEDKPLINNSLKRKRTEIVSKRHPNTGQPIAKDEYVKEYEMEHQQLLTRGKDYDKFIDWPYAMEHHNLDSYCCQYIKACAPRRCIEKVIGTWNTQKLHYVKLNTNEDINVITITCMLLKMTKQNYYITRAPESNCVYSLIRKGRRPQSPLVIIFKHCDFEDPNNQQTISNSTQKAEVKEVTFDTLELLPKY